MKNIFICDTPFQILNSINIVWHQNKIGRDDINVILIINQFESAHYMSEKIRKSKLFNYVILANKEDRQSIKNNVIRHLLVAKDYVFFKNFIKRHFEKKDQYLIFEVIYDCVYSSVMSHFAVAVLSLNTNANFVLFDDGAGSYSGLITDGVAPKYHKIAQFLSKGNALRIPSKLLLSQPDFYNGNMEENSYEIDSLPRIDSNFFLFLSSCFDLNTQKEISERIIYLTQPYLPKELNKEVNTKLLSVLDDVKDNILVRTHPRDYDLSTYDNYKFEQPDVLWELRLTQIKDLNNAVLLSFYSTAQMTPKFLYNTEPYLVFMFRLHPALSNDYCLQCHEMVEKFRKMYNNPEKIFEPKTVDELKIIIHDLCKVG